MDCALRVCIGVNCFTLITGHSVMGSDFWEIKGTQPTYLAKINTVQLEDLNLMPLLALRKTLLFSELSLRHPSKTSCKLSIKRKEKFSRTGDYRLHRLWCNFDTITNAVCSVTMADVANNLIKQQIELTFLHKAQLILRTHTSLAFLHYSTEYPIYC